MLNKVQQTHQNIDQMVLITSDKSKRFIASPSWKHYVYYDGEFNKQKTLIFELTSDYLGNICNFFACDD